MQQGGYVIGVIGKLRCYVLQCHPVRMFAHVLNNSVRKSVEQILSNAKAQKLKETYNIVGRYLTGTVGGSKPKYLTSEELQILAENNLRVFPIFQDGGASLAYFGNYQGQLDARNAIIAARKLHIPNDTIIYFAVDYDFTEKQVLERVIPHFQGIKTVFDASISKYRIGIYGSRNTCSIVCEDNLAISSFVSDMSTGYSGNMGFPLPINWAFDQIYEYTTTASDGTTFAVDKDVTSGRDRGFAWGELCGGERFDDCTQHSMVMEADGYFTCLSCGYNVPSPFLQDEAILSSDDFLKLEALLALYYITLGDDRHNHLLNPICLKMQEIRNKKDHIGKYAYHDEDNKCIHIPPEGEYNDTYVMLVLHDPVVVTTLNINEYNGVFDELADAIYGLAVDKAFNASLALTVADLLENPDITMSLYEIVKYLASEAKQTAWGFVLELIQLGVKITDAEANAKVIPGDIVVSVVYPEGALAGQANIVFDSNRQLKSIASQ